MKKEMEKLALQGSVSAQQERNLRAKQRLMRKAKMNALMKEQPKGDSVDPVDVAVIE